MSPEVAAHLNRCSSCRKEAERLHRLWELLGRVDEIGPSPDFDNRVWKAIREHRTVTKPRPFVWSVIARVAQVALLIIVLWVGVALGRGLALAPGVTDGKEDPFKDTSLVLAAYDTSAQSLSSVYEEIGN